MTVLTWRVRFGDKQIYKHRIPCDNRGRDWNDDGCESKEHQELPEAKRN
jgi:hypothetical protein